MKPCKEPFDLTLAAGATVTIADAAGVGIGCCQGCVWITLDGDSRDIVLEAGGRFEQDGHRRALVSALKASNIAVSCALQATLPRSACSSIPWDWRWRSPGSFLCVVQANSRA